MERNTDKTGDTTPAGRRVSILPSEMIDPPRRRRRQATGLLAALMDYTPTEDATAKGRKISGCPADVDDALSVVRRLTNGKLSREMVAEYLIGHGVALLARLEGIRVIDEAREALETAGDTPRADSLRWTFHVACDGKRDLWPRIDDETWKACSQLAKVVGVPIATMAVLALMASLIHLPIADHVRSRMVDQLVAFRDRVREQADEAAAKAARAQPATAERSFDFARDVLGKRPHKGVGR